MTFKTYMYLLKVLLPTYVQNNKNVSSEVFIQTWI